MFSFILHFLLFFFGNNKYFNLQNFICKHNLVSPKLWSIYGSTSNFNIALPDAFASYRGSFICIGDNDIITLESDIPIARYYSVQVYDSSTASLGSLNDHQIEVKDNKFVISITKKNKNVNLNSNTLQIETSDNFLVILYRVYDVPNVLELDQKLTISSVEINELFGWIRPPNIYKYDKKTNVTINIPHTNAPTIIEFPRMYRNFKPVREHRFSNEKDNFFKPTTNAFFSNDDASYLVSLIKVNENERIGAVITGLLPLTDYKNKNYFKEIKSYNKTCTNISIDHPDYYEVRYISFNMGSTSMPLPTIAGPMLYKLKNKQIDSKTISSTGKAGIRDIDIISRYGNTPEWNAKGRPYKIYIGFDIEHVKSLGGDPYVDLYMTYPIHYTNGIPFKYSVVVFRHLMSQGKFMETPIFKHGIGEILENPAVPEECERTMSVYYPRIEFFY